MSTEHFYGLSGNMSYHSPTESELTASNLGQAFSNENGFNSDSDPDDLVGASVNFALRRTSEAAVWYRQKRFENGGPWPEGTIPNQASIHAITPSALERIPPTQTQFNQTLLSSSGTESHSASSSSKSPALPDRWQESNRGRSEQSIAKGQSTPNYSEDHAAPSARKKRRRKFEDLDPDSARARYLEKNRDAATRCRRNQKKKTENLVEKARTMEEKNKILKVEVACLKDDMASLMNVVASHSRCPDSRLQTYVQREADRLADGRRPSYGNTLGL